MKVALLFSGQLRRIPQDLFKKSLLNLTKDLDYSIFSYCWEEEGKSLNHDKNISQLNPVENIEDRLNFMFKDFNLINYGYESFKEFEKYLPAEHKEIFNSKKFHFGTVNSLPQIYALYKSYQLLINNGHYFDLIFRCRYDSLFVHPLYMFPLEKILNNNFLYNINFGRSFYPNRAYDIFFGGSQKSMKFLSNIWLDLPSLVNNNFCNGLDKRDSCRIIYLAASLENIKVKSFESRICDVFRNDKNKYINYLISSHFIKTNLNFKNFKIIKISFKWLKDNNLINLGTITCLIKTLFFVPFAYIKRIKYLKIKRIFANHFFKSC